MEQRGRTLDELIPSWTFAARTLPARLATGAAITAVSTAPLWAARTPVEVRLGPVLVLGLVAVAALAGSTATLLSSLVVVPWYWYGNVPGDGWELSSVGDTMSVLAMSVLAIGLVVLTRTMEASVAAVRDLDEHRQLENLAESAGRIDAEREADQVRAALELSNQLAAAQDQTAVATLALAGLALPIAPTSSSIAIIEDGRLKILAARNAHPRSLAVLQQVDLSESDWLTGVLAGEPALVDDRAEFAKEHPGAGVLRIYPAGSWAAIPFRSEGTVGLLSVHYMEPQPLTSYRVYFSLVAETLATTLQRAASDEARSQNLAQLEHTLGELEQSLAERDRIARTLSTTLLPPRLPQLPGFSAAAWLLPASADEVAGDFYDLFALATGGWVAVVGDVCGKGAEAAAVTSLARYATRVTALDDPHPGHIADVANSALTLDPSDLFCTMALVRYIVGAERIDVTLAGHPQARLLRSGEVTRAGQFGPALGLGTTSHRTTSHPFEPGDSVILFSDGLIERDRTFGEDELDASLAAMGSGDASTIAERLRELILGLPADRADDLTVLVITRDP